MKRTDIIDMAQTCVQELNSLRTQVAMLAPKAHAYDTLTQVLGLLPQPSQGYSEDLVWRLEKQIKDLRAEEAADHQAYQEVKP